MQYLYLDIDANRLFAVSKRPLEKGSAFNLEHHTELIVSDDFNLLKPELDETGQQIVIDGKPSFAEKTASEILSEVNYVDNRLAQYPSVVDQLDMLWHAMNDGLLPSDNPFYEAIKAVKDTYPKP